MDDSCMVENENNQVDAETRLYRAGKNTSTATVLLASETNTTDNSNRRTAW
jgi:hypothetical protein